MAQPNPTRRALIGAATTALAYAGGAAIVGTGIAVASTARGEVVARQDGDAALLAAFARREKAYADFQALPVNDTAGERALWAIVDDAEYFICEAKATTLAGLKVQLWVAMYHSVTGREDDAAVTRGDFAALDRIDTQMDWNARLMLAALRSIEAMEAQA